MVLVSHLFCVGFTIDLTGFTSVLMSCGLAVKVIWLMLQWSLLISSEVPTVISLGMQTLLSELLVIIKGKVLLYNVALFIGVG